MIESLVQGFRSGPEAVSERGSGPLAPLAVDAYAEKSDPERLCKRPVVSVCMITYNHAPYIREALESIVGQKCDFEFELIVGEDCSKDGTREVCLEYQAKYPQIVRVLFSDQNVGPYQNDLRVMGSVRGEFVSLCEGDDYFTDVNKLQKQVECLRKHAECAVCFHPVRVVYEEETRPEEIFPSREYRYGKTRLGLDDLLKRNFIQTNSCMYRWRFGKSEDVRSFFLDEIIPGDWYLHLLHAQKGAIIFLDEVMAVYRRHKGGIWSDAAAQPERLTLKYGIQKIGLFYHIYRFVANGSQRYFEGSFLPIVSRILQVYFKNRDFDSLRVAREKIALYGLEERMWSSSYLVNETDFYRGAYKRVRRRLVMACVIIAVGGSVLIVLAARCLFS